MRNPEFDHLILDPTGAGPLMDMRSTGSNEDAMSGPLHGIRVLELSVAFSAPYAGVQLCDLGADVVEIEAPGGEPFRVLGTPVAGAHTSPPLVTTGTYSEADIATLREAGIIG